jgi:t-SNARE complex subunit (syntaxin)
MTFYAETSDQKTVYNDLIKPFTPYLTYQWLVKQNHKTVSSMCSHSFESSIRKSNAFFEIYDAIKVCKIREEDSIDETFEKLISIVNNNINLFLKDCTNLQDECRPLKNYLIKVKEISKNKPLDAKLQFIEEDGNEQTESKEEVKTETTSFCLDRNTPTLYYIVSPDIV